VRFSVWIFWPSFISEIVGRDDDLAHVAFLAHRVNPVLEVLLDLVLVPE